MKLIGIYKFGVKCCFLFIFLVLFCGATDLREIVQFVKKLNEIERMKIQQKKTFRNSVRFPIKKISQTHYVNRNIAIFHSKSASPASNPIEK